MFSSFFHLGLYSTFLISYIAVPHFLFLITYYISYGANGSSLQILTTMKTWILTGFLLIVLACTQMAVANSQEPEIDRTELREQRKQEREQRKQQRQQQRQLRKESKLEDKQRNNDQSAPTESNPPTQTPEQTEGNHTKSPEYDQIIEQDNEKSTDNSADKSRQSKQMSEPLPTNSNYSAVSDTPKRNEHPVNLPSETSPSNNITASSRDSNPPTTLIIIGVIICLFFLFLKHRYSGKCPHCKKYRAMVELDQAYLGRIKREKVNNEYIYHNKIQVHRKCRYCGYEDYITRIEKGK